MLCVGMSHCSGVQAMGAPLLLLGHQLVCLEGELRSAPNTPHHASMRLTMTADQTPAKAVTASNEAVQLL